MKLNYFLIPGISEARLPQTEQQFMGSIEQAVCIEFGLTIEEIHKDSNKSELVLARNVFYYLCRKYSHILLKTVSGRYNKNHATAIHGIKIVTSKIEASSNFAIRMRNLEARINKFHCIR